MERQPEQLMEQTETIWQPEQLVEKQPAEREFEQLVAAERQFEQLMKGQLTERLYLEKRQPREQEIRLKLK